MFLVTGSLVLLFVHPPAPTPGCAVVSLVSRLYCFVALLNFVGFVCFERINDRDFRIELLMEITTRKPAGKKWRTIAHSVNQDLFNEGLWHRTYYFYCDRECQSFFILTAEKASNGTDWILQELTLKAVKAEKEARHEFWKKQYPDFDSL